MKLGLNSGFMAEGLFENLKVLGSESDNICNTSGKMFIGREIMIIESPDHKLNCYYALKHDQR
jgi:hypothetical protein